MNRIVLLLLALARSLTPILCWAVEPTVDHWKAITEIQKAGGTVRIDEKNPDRSAITVEFQHGNATDNVLEYVKALTNVQTLERLQQQGN